MKLTTLYTTIGTPLALAFTTALAASAEPAPRPNIVIILGDDMGYSDIGCYGSEIATPNLDSLAKEGVRFTQFYNAARCCPTRAALLTGLYSHQAGIGLMEGDSGYDGYRGELSRKAVTLAEALRPAGYRTYMAGKWHVTSAKGPNSSNANWPIQRGFDRFYGTITGAGSFYDPATLCRDNKFITPVNDTEYRPKQFYYTDAISDNAVKFMQDHAKEHSKQPLFMYVAYTCAHWPMHAPEEDIAKTRGKYDAGYDAMRLARFKRARDLGVLDPRWKMSPTAGNWDNVKNKEWEIRCMEVYAAMVGCMDRGIGRMIAELKRQGQLDNTLFLYLEDNGGCAEGFGRGSNADAVKDQVSQVMGPDELQTKIWPPMQTRDGRPVLSGPAATPGPEDGFVGYGRDWANVSNTPFRGYKHDALEGGISTPFIVHWPAGIPASRHHAVVNSPAHLIDLMATCVDVAKTAYPKQFKGESIQPMEGVSLLPACRGEELQRAAPLAWEHHGNSALRDGKWKIVTEYRANQPTKWELYDMDADRTELHDLAAEQPQKLKEMVGKWQAWAERVGVQPWPLEKKIEKKEAKAKKISKPQN
ncbi:MAG: arylsulfatase [Verrucomicrobia bacterium]|nr:arylsulfatase [Verrucomicrobiota bacterium]